MELLTVIQDIILVHDRTARAAVTEWGCLLPELLDAVLCEVMPAMCRRELTTTIGVVTNSRGGKLTANITKFKDLLLSDDFNTTNPAVLANKRFAEMPSSLAAFAGVFDTCGDFATQCNAVQILHAAGKLGGLDSSLVAKGFGDVRKEFIALIQKSDDTDEDYMDKTQVFVTDYNVSRGGNAR